MISTRFKGLFRDVMQVNKLSNTKPIKLNKHTYQSVIYINT